MPDLLLELYCEEMPTAMQEHAAQNLKKQVTDALTDKGLTYEAAMPYWTPRRLTLDLRGLSKKSRDIHEKRKGPAVKAPKTALEGFMRAAGLNALDEAEIISDPKKGDYYSISLTRKGRPAEDILAEILPPVIRNFSWPKSMRWGAASVNEDTLRWVRPLHSILCLLSTDTESQIIPFTIGAIKSGDYTFGHPFMYGRTPIKIRRFDDYAAKLDKAKVILDARRRKNIILADAHNLCFAKGLELVEDARLAEEVAGLVEWPVVLLGTFDTGFLSIPPEIIRVTIRNNQKCFVTRPMAAEQTNKPLKLANHFILIANIEAKDKGKEIIKGNGKVVQARLSDALYFWQTDQKSLPDLPLLEPSAKKFALDLRKPLDSRMARLDALNVTFHAKLGTQGARVARIAALAEKIAPLIGADRKQVRRAAYLAKADLQTEIVGEFPELQGQMGRKYALLQGENPEIAAAIEEHYKPQGPKDNVPRGLVSVAVALADKIDSLVGFWLIDEKPTGSKDPYALRRAALGTIRLVLSQEWQISLMPLFCEAAQLLHTSIIKEHMRHFSQMTTAKKTDKNKMAVCHIPDEEKQFEEQLIAHTQPALQDLLGFFHERFKIYLREEGARYDVIDAVLKPQTDNLLKAARKIEALLGFIGNADGTALLSGAKRALNILTAEENKKTAIAEHVDSIEFITTEETVLYDSILQAEKKLKPLLEEHNFNGGLAVLAKLRAPIDAFFENVLINDKNITIRANRLAILIHLRRLFALFADFSKLSG